MQLGQLKMSFLLYCEILPSSIYKNPMKKNCITFTFAPTENVILITF